MSTLTTRLPAASLAMPLRRLAGTLWQRLRHGRTAAPLAPADYASLAYLNEATLRDIGAPDWVHERAGGGVPLWMLERVRW